MYPDTVHKLYTAVCIQDEIKVTGASVFINPYKEVDDKVRKAFHISHDIDTVWLSAQGRRRGGGY